MMERGDAGMFRAMSMKWAAGRRPLPVERNVTDERDLVHRARGGDADAFAGLVRVHQDRIYRLALRMAGPDAAEDLAQQAFIRAWQGLDRFDGGAAFGTWLYRIAINACLDHQRRVKRFPALSLDDAAWPADCGDDPAEQVADAAERSDRRAALAWALERLPDDDRLLLHLRVAEERTYEEIADLLQLNVRTVGTRLYRARARLHQLVSRSPGEEDGDDLR
jgi:RNA polymerase sigma factor (sigma-70 family)